MGHQTKATLDFNLHKLYEIHRDLLLTMVKLELGEVLDQAQFQTLWAWCERLNIENLLVEMLARKHLKLSHPFSAFVEMGEFCMKLLLKSHLPITHMGGGHSMQLHLL